MVFFLVFCTKEKNCLRENTMSACNNDMLLFVTKTFYFKVFEMELRDFVLSYKQLNTDILNCYFIQFNL